MKNKLLISITLLSILIPSFVFSDDTAVAQYKEGDKFTDFNYTFEDPDGNKKNLKPETELLITSFEMELSKSIHTWLAEKDANFLENHKTQYIADITEMPSIISYLFAKPKMSRYKFPILLADDEKFAEKYPIQEGKFMVFELTPEKNIKYVSYFSTMDEVNKKYFEPTAEIKNN